MPALMFWGLSPCSWSITSYIYGARCDLWSSNYLRHRVLEDKYSLNISAPCCSWHTVMAGSHDVGYLHVFQYADTVALSEALRDVQKRVIEGNKTNPSEPSWVPGLKALAAAVQFSDLRFSTEFLVGYTWFERIMPEAHRNLLDRFAEAQFLLKVAKVLCESLLHSLVVAERQFALTANTTTEADRYRETYGLVHYHCIEFFDQMKEILSRLSSSTRPGGHKTELLDMPFHEMGSFMERNGKTYAEKAQTDWRVPPKGKDQIRDIQPLYEPLIEAIASREWYRALLDNMWVSALNAEEEWEKIEQQFYKRTAMHRVEHALEFILDLRLFVGDIIQRLEDILEPEKTTH